MKKTLKLKRKWDRMRKEYKEEGRPRDRDKEKEKGKGEQKSKLP